MIYNAFVGFVCSNKCADEPCFLVLEQFEFPDTSFLPFAPPSIDFGPELGHNLFLLLAGNYWYFGEIAEFPVANYFLFGVVVFIDIFVLFFVLGVQVG